MGVHEGRNPSVNYGVSRELFWEHYLKLVCFCLLVELFTYDPYQ